MIKRPSTKDDEDELVRMQSEYMSSKQKPSATVVRIPKQNKGKDLVTLSGIIIIIIIKITGTKTSVQNIKLYK